MAETATSELVPRFIEACETEGREHSLVPREYRLVRGERIVGSAGRYLYRFQALSKIPIKEDSAAELRAGEALLPASLVRKSGTSIELAIPMDLGEAVDEAVLLLEVADMLRALGARLEAVQEGAEGFNTALAQRVFSLDALSQEPAFEPLRPTEGLTEEQHRAAAGLSALEVGFLWGPPGTGKTATLGALAHAAFAANRRTLIVSHTNDAVDALLHSVCRRISGRAKLAIPEGSVVRLGPISDADLSDEFGAQIELESVLARAQEKTAKRLDGLRADHRKLCERISGLESLLALSRSESSLRAKLELLHSQRRATRPGLFATLRRVFYGWGKVQEVVVDETVDLDAEIAMVEGGLKKLTASLGSTERGRLPADLADAKAEEPEVAAAVFRLEEVLREVRRGSLERARIVATTATRAFLAPEHLREFDLVIIDEASMLPLPLVYLLAGLAETQVVVAGDFRQLPPIALSADPTVREWYARDIFEATGVVGLVERGELHPCVFVLTTQFRCRDEIASLFSQSFYEGRLSSSYTPRLALDYCGILAPLSGKPLVVLDTSSLSPSGQTVSRSKANLLHACLIRDLRTALITGAQAISNSDLGIVSPYRPQVALLRDLINEEGGHDVGVGTVHRFQGDERPIIILDLTESHPHRLGSFLGATSRREPGAKLLNVALSRAKEQLIIVADLSHLRRSLTPRHILHHILDAVRERKAIIDASSLFESGISRSGERLESRLQGHTRAVFLSEFLEDLRNARQSATIVSPAVALSLVKVVANVLATREERLNLKLFVPAFEDGVAGSLDDYETSLELLAQVGAEIAYCKRDPAPLVLTDTSAAWFGSLSPLACLDTEVGSMVRVGGRAAVAAAGRLLRPEALVLEQPFKATGN